MNGVQKIGLLVRYRKTFGAFPKKRTSFTSRSLKKLLQDRGFDIAECIVLGTKTRSLLVRAVKKAG